MTTIHDAYINALLADATYALSVTGTYLDDDLKGALTTRMTLTLANFIGDNFYAATHIDASDNPLLGTGFDATVWRGNAGTEFAGKTYVSLTGSEALADFAVADLNLTVSGAAVNQIVDMVNWWLKNTTAINQQAQQITWNGGAFANIATVTGTGIITERSNIVVDGHSLGGHLATAFTRLFGGQAGWSIDHTYTYNSAGFTASSEGIFKQIEALLGTGISKGYFEGLVGQSNFFAENGINVTTRTFLNGQEGLRTPLFNEETSFPVNNHYMYKLTDALALGDAIAKLDSTFDTTKMSTLFDKSANKTEESLEKVLDAFRRTILGNGVSDTPVGDVSDSAASRLIFHENLNTLQNSDIFKALAGKVTLVAPPTSAAEARSDLGLFLSLYYLTPFALKTDGSIATDAQLTIAHPDLATQFKEDKLLTPAQIANGEANFSDLYLADRAAMLSWVNKLNGLDIDAPASSPYITNGADQHFKDFTTDKEIFINGLVNESSDFIFGSDAGADNLTGHNKNDHLYGMAGDDTLNGGKGSDWLEGGADDDMLNGEDDADTLLGGTGADTLNGGKGNDQLKGGAGNDTYIHNTNDGNDIIIDGDGSGTINVNGQTLHGGKKIDSVDNLWQSEDKLTRYALYDENDGTQTLNIFTGSERIFVKNWQTNQLGINLQEANPNPITPTPITSDHDYLNVAMDSAMDGQSGNDALIGAAGAEKLYGGIGNDIIFGNAGDDVLEGGSGNDILEGGVGHDVVLGGAGDDLIMSNNNHNDIAIHQQDAQGSWQLVANSDQTWRAIAASSTWGFDSGVAGDRFRYFNGNSLEFSVKWTSTDPAFGFTNATNNDNTQGDIIYGGDGNDAVLGSQGDDYLSGDAEDDTVWAGRGNDIVMGGNGNDEVFGGDDNDYIDGESEDDNLIGGYGADEIYGGAGHDVLTGDLPALQGTSPAAPPTATNFSLMGNDMLDGGAGNDKLWGGGGADTLLGGDDDDELVGDGIGTPSTYEGADFLDGGIGNDKLWGGGKGDFLYGGEGDDTIYGDSSEIPDAANGDDYIDGGIGNDYLLGQGGKDTLYGGDGNDTLFGDADQVAIAFHGNDYLDGGSGNDQLQGAGGNDILLGSVGDDVLYGEEGDDSLSGGAGNDQLAGGDGDDTLDGGAGVDGLWGEAGNDTLIGTGGTKDANGNYTGGDVLYGGEGDDTYYIQAGDIVDDTQGSNIINANVGTSDLQLAASILAIGTGDGDYIFIQNALTGGENNLLQLGGNAINQADLIEAGLTTAVNLTTTTQFAVGGKQNDILTAGTTIGTTLRGGAGNDTLTGNAGDDILKGGTGADVLNGSIGNDIMSGGAGNDTYTLSIGDGFDSIEDTQGLNQINFGVGVSRASVHVSQYQGDDGSYYLLVQYGSGQDKVAIKDGLAGGIQSYRFEDGTVITHAELIGAEGMSFHVYGTQNADALVGTNSGDTLEGKAGDDQLLGLGGDDNLYGDSGADALLGDAGNDLLDGGLGDDQLEGGAGQDSYVMRWGMGKDTVIDGADGELNMIKLDARISISDLASQRNGNDLFLHFKGSEEGLLIKSYYLGEQQWVFNPDGWIFYAENDPLAINGTQNSDAIIGTVADDILAGKTGNDQLDGSDGYDTLLGGGGADTLLGGADDDYLYGDNGNDQLEGGAGADRYVMHLGMGQDTVVEAANGELNFIEPGEGVNLSDLTTQRMGNDLLVHFKDAEDGLLIKNYYLGGQNWAIYNNADDSNVALSDFIDTPASVVEQRIEAYEARITALYYQTLGNDGFISVDGSLQKTETYLTSYSSTSYQYENWGVFFNTQESDGEYIERVTPAPETNIQQLISTSVRLASQFTGSGYGSTLAGSGATFHSFDGTGGSFQVPLGSSVSVGNGGVWIYSGSSGNNAYAFYSSSYKVISYLTLETILGGSSDNSITLGGYAVVDAGGGDDVISVSNGGPGWERSFNLRYVPDEYQYEKPDSRNIGSLLYGNAGDDVILGGSANDLLIGGEGSDLMNGRGSADTYLVSAGETGRDIIVDTGTVAQLEGGTTIYMDWYYRSIGITDWQSRYYANNHDNALAGLPPLPVISPTDYSALAPLYAAGIFDMDVVEFGSGINLADMSFSWGQVVPSEHVTNWPTNEFIATLDISWGVDQGVRIGIPLLDVNSLDNTNADGSKWFLETGIEQFKFADGTIKSLAELVSLAPPMPNAQPISFDVGSGQLSASYLWKSLIQIGPNAKPEDITLSRDGADLLIVHDNGVDQLRIQGWFQATGTPPPISIMFGVDGPLWRASDLDHGLVMGGADNDMLYGVNGYKNFIFANGCDDSITAGDTGDYIDGGAGNDTVYGGSGYDQIRGGDGNDVLSASAGLIGDSIYGDAGNDILIGSHVGDNLMGGIGNDTIHGDAGNDWLNGGLDDDVLTGGPDDDVYYFYSGSGHDQIDNTATDNATATDTLYLDNVAPTDVVLSRISDDLLITLSTSDSITVNNYYAGIDNKIDQIKFSVYDANTDTYTDTIWDRSTFEPMVLGGNGNHEPIVVNAIAAQAALEDVLFSFTVPADAFTDVDAGDTLRYSATLADGTALPSWIVFDLDTRAFIGVPTNDHVGEISFKLTATDSAGASVFQIFKLTVQNVNDLPTFTTPSVISFTDTVNPDAFVITTGDLMGADIDGNTLSYGIIDGTDNGETVSKSSAFGVLTITKPTGTYSFTPNNAAIEAIKTDAIESFTITITDGIIAEPLVTTLTINLTGANDPTSFTGTISGDMTEDSTQPVTGSISVSDRDVGDAVIAAQTDTIGSYGDFSIASNGQWTYTLRNTDGNAQALKADQAVTDTFIVVTAGGAEQAITINVHGSNDTPTLVGTQPTLEAGVEDVAYTITQASLLSGFSDADGDSLRVIDLAMTPSTAQAGTLSTFDPVSQSWTFTPTANFNGTVNLSYTVTDGIANTAAIQSFNLAAVNDAPTGNLNVVGIRTQGQVLTANTTLLADADGLGTFTYQWQSSSDGITWYSISGAVFANYTLTATEAGKNVRVQTAYTDGSGNVELIHSDALGIGKLIIGTSKNDSLTGTVNDDRIEGLAGNDIINGGTGADIMLGGLGNDTYYIDSIGDIIIENLSQGTDLVNSAISFTLGNNLENLVLTGTAIYGLGNQLNNAISGNAIANTLEGGLGKDSLYGFSGNDTLNGGEGADTMIGGLGDDQYYVDHTNDAVKESANQGTDIVYSKVSYTLTANVEKLILTGTDAINGTGNKLNNSIIGNVAVNKLTGGSGNDFIDGDLGNDILKGGVGSDTFSFSSQLSVMNIDTISDFSRGTDHLGLDARIFTQLFNDDNLADNLVVGVDGVKALDTNDYLIYNTKTKALYYDADGSGTGAAVQFATLANVATLSASDFVVM